MNAGDEEKKEALDAEARSSPSGAVIYKAILKEGIDELARPSSALFWSGIAAGLLMGASLIAEGLLDSYLPNAPWRPLVSKFGYSMGFLVVILGRQQLFTENTLTPILPLLQDKTVARFWRVMRLWAIVLASNLMGCLAVAWIANSDFAFSTRVQQEFSQIGHQALEGGFVAHLMRGVFAGWLIALMVWLLPFRRDRAAVGYYHFELPHWVGPFQPYRRGRGANVLRGGNRRKFLGSSHRRILSSHFSGERCWGSRTGRSAQSRPGRLRSEKQEGGVFSSLE